MTLAVVAGAIAKLMSIAVVGAVVHRLGRLDEGLTRGVGRLVVDVCMPSLLFTQLVATTTRAGLADGLWLVAFGALVCGVPWLVGRRAGLTPTATFLAGLPNWIYLPLPIAQAAYGDDGVRVVLLANLGATVAIWTAGVATLQGRVRWEAAVNPGVLATAAGLVSVLVAPSLPGPAWSHALAWDTLEALAAPTIPLALLVTGAAAAAAPWPGREAVVVTALRLLAWPVATVAALAVAQALGAGLDRDATAICALVASMPVAASATAFAERFGGDPRLAAQTLLLTTPLSWLTVPLLLALARALGA